MDGRHLKKGLELAAELIGRELDFINAINVYPVADGDTGTNMYSTVAGIVDALKDVNTRHAGKVAELAAEAALESARGNSGVIISQFFWGFSEGVGGAEVLDKDAVVAAFSEGKEWAYRAVSNPVEGTILTVMREAAEGARRFARAHNSVPELMHGVYQASLSALERTPEMLRRLGKPKVIDSGAYGFTLLVEGFVRSLGVSVEGYRIRGVRVETGGKSGGPALFCTNYLIELNNGATAEKIRAAVEKHGDSIVVVCNGSKAKVHVHTGDPHAVKNALQFFGRVVQERVERIW